MATQNQVDVVLRMIDDARKRMDSAKTVEEYMRAKQERMMLENVLICGCAR